MESFLRDLDAIRRTLAHRYNEPVMKIFGLISGLFLVIFLFVLPSEAKGQGPSGSAEEYSRALVVEVLEETNIEVAGYSNPYQRVLIQFESGPNSGQKLELDHGGIYTIGENQKVKAGQIVVVSTITQPEGDVSYWITDKYRVMPMLFIGLMFLALVLLTARWRGLGSVLGMLLSLLVIMRFIVPQILAGRDPLLISLIGSLFIMFTTMYLAHGYSRQTSLAILATFLTLALTGILAYLFVGASHLTGMGSEDAYSLQFGPTQVINLKGLLLGGIIIGALGVLDDVTTTQAATIFELARGTKKLKFLDLWRRGMRVGREHVTSLVNTLVMAYAGASLPLFIFFVLNPTDQPLWVILNHELIAEEIIRSLAGSFGLVLAVPLTTALCAFTVTKFGLKGLNSSFHHHHTYSSKGE